MERGFTFVETPDMPGLEDATLRAIQRDLQADPLRWPVVKGTGGARKGRIAGRGKGKRGGLRYLYLYVKRKERIYLLWLYSKGEQSDLTPAQAKRIRQVVEAINAE